MVFGSASAPAWARSIPFAIYIGFLAVQQGLAAWQPQWDLRWLYGAQVLSVLLALVLLWPAYAELRRTSASTRDWLLAAGVGAVVFVLWINLNQDWAVLGSLSPYDPRGADGSLNWSLVALRLGGAALVVPVMEELFWRSFILRWLERQDFLAVLPATIGSRALLLTSVLFALEHTLWFAGLLAGLAYGWLYIRTGSLWVTIFSHGLTNGLLGAWVVTTGSWEFW